MNSRIVIASISIFMMLASSIPALGLSINEIPELKEVSEEIDVPLNANNATVFYTKGPVKRVATIELISGNQTQIEKINETLSKCSKIRSRLVFVENLTFKINYTKRVLMCSRYRYRTVLGMPNATDNESANYTYRVVKNKKHEVIVTNFTGTFMYIRPKIIAPGRIRLFQPAQFVFMGECENVTLTVY